MAKKNNYISADLDFAEAQIATWKQYVQDHPIDKLADRVAWKQVKGGGQMPVVVSTIEQQIKAITDLMAKYLQMLEVIEHLRQAEEKKALSVRGNLGLSPFEEGDI